VHAADLAAACAAALGQAATHGRTYPLGGAERLRFDAMVARLRACVAGPVLRLPLPLTVLGLIARVRPHGGFFGRAAVARLRQSLVADNAPAMRDFGYAPRAFDAGSVCGGTNAAQFIQI